MSWNFDRWEKDPFFSTAEQVQESADRMESAYRTWLHERKNPTGVCDPEELRRDLHTTHGTAKWQLDEFERAVRMSYGDSSAKDAKTRHGQFIQAIGDQIETIENSLKETAMAEGKATHSWVRLDEGERDELAMFLSGSSADLGLMPVNSTRKVEPEEEEGNAQGTPEMAMPECSKNSSRTAEAETKETKEEKLIGHRRTASASADIGTWKIEIADEGFHHAPLNIQPDRPPPRILSFSGLLNPVEITTKIKNASRKWKPGDCHQAEDSIPLHTTRGIDACYERSKSCLDSCDDSYEKHLYGWMGVVQRQLQRSQYQIQYSRPVQVAMWIIFVLCLLVLFILRAI